MTGTVTVVYGCMFSGKTTELLRRLESVQLLGSGRSKLPPLPRGDRGGSACYTKTNSALAQYPRGKALAFKHAIDTRYSASAIVSHGGKASPAIVVKDGDEIERYVIGDIGMVAIDEAHFFDEKLADVVARLAKRGIDTVLTSLQPDSWGRPFPLVERLLAVADEPILTTATCARCGAVADRTQRLTPIVDGNMVVEPSNYEPRCRKCWRPPDHPRIV